jgi:hypothetical protein
LLNIQDKKNWPVVSIDTLDNDLVRFHDNPNAARVELSSLLGITDLKPSRNFTQTYITGPSRNGQITTPSKFNKRFKLLWLKDCNPSSPRSTILDRRPGRDSGLAARGAASRSITTTQLWGVPKPDKV